MKKYTLLLASCLLYPLISFASVEIKFWQFWSPEWIQPLIDKFEKENPDIRVSLERLTWADGQDKIITAFAANQAPDVLEIGSTWVAGFSQGGGLKTIEPKELLKKLANWESVYYDGKYYGVPWTLSTGAMFYNKDLIKKANFSAPPQNWEELYEQSKAIQNLGKNIYGFGIKTGAYTTWQKFLPFAWSNGARLINADWKTTGVASEPFYEAVVYYNKLKEYSLFDENLVIRKSFQEGKVGFMLDDSGQIKKFQKESPELNFGVAPLPAAPTGKSINFAGAQILAIGKNTKNQAAAEKLIRFLVLPENVSAITKRITTLFPADKESINSDFYQKEHPELLIFIEILKTSTSPVAHPYWVEIQEIFTEQLERTLFGENIKKALNKAQKRIQTVLEEEL